MHVCFICDSLSFYFFTFCFHVFLFRLPEFISNFLNAVSYIMCRNFASFLSSFHNVEISCVIHFFFPYANFSFLWSRLLTVMKFNLMSPSLSSHFHFVHYICLYICTFTPSHLNSGNSVLFSIFIVYFLVPLQFSKFARHWKVATRIWHLDSFYSVNPHTWDIYNYAVDFCFVSLRCHYSYAYVFFKTSVGFSLIIHRA